VVQQTVRYSVLGDQPTVLGVLYDLASNRLPLLVALIVGLYVARRLVDLVYERTGWRLVGLAVG
jgi:hypothetical protein